MVLMSHLSDIQTGAVKPSEISLRCNFLKHLIMKYGHEKKYEDNVLNRFFEIDPQAEWEIFVKHYPPFADHPENKEEEKKFEPTDESKAAFNKAIAEGRLSNDQYADNFAGHYMYMGNHNGKDAFKHRRDRNYID